MTRYKFSQNAKYLQYFSFEILDYFDSITTDENFKWIEKYFNVLMKNENINTLKFDNHHIIPCALLKDENHKFRNETVILANEINGNLIKLSYENHIIAHYCLWKIFPNNEDIRRPIYLMLGKININELTETKVKELAKIQEECRKANMTDEEKKEYLKNWHLSKKEERNAKAKEYHKNNKEHLDKKAKEWREKNKEERNRKERERYKNNKEKYQKQHKEYYENNKEILAKKEKEYRKNNKEKLSEKGKERNNRLCYDPIKEEYCNYNILKYRKSKNKEKYKDVILKDCIIQPQPQS